MYKLSPSDFAYLYEDCKLCYWLKIKHGVMPPPGIFPSVFSTMNSIMQGQMVGHSLREFGKDLPDIRVVSQEGYVRSMAIEGTSVYTAGKYDLLCDNGDGTFTVVDLKISKPDVGKVDKYKTQLGSYKYALEHPSAGDSIIVSKLALLIFYPDKASFNDSGAVFDFPAKWMEIPVDDEAFISFAHEIDDLLSGPAPTESETCQLCKYRHRGEDITHHLANPSASAETIISSPNNDDTETEELPF